MAARLLPLALLLLLCAAMPTAAAALETPVGDLPVLALEEDEEPEAEAAAEEVEEECEEVEEGYEECEEVEEDPAHAAAEPRDECVLRSAHGHAALDRRGEKLKVTIGYTASEPAKAKIEIGHIATLDRHLGRSGVLRITKKLGAKPARRLVVTIELPSARNAGCPHRRLVLVAR
jgi:hypothetical protein